MTIADPWASAAPAADEPQTAPETAPASIAAPAVKVDSSGDKITLTFKGAGNFSDRWLVAHVGTPTEGLALLNDPQFKELLDLSRRIGEYDAGAAQAQPAASSGGGQQRQAAPRGAEQPPEWAPPMPDGYKYASGTKDGRVWHAYFPIRQNSGLDKIWLNPPRN